MINYLANSLRCIVKEAGLQNSAVERIMRNTDLRCDPKVAKIAIGQIKNALGSHKLQKAVRKDAKRIIGMLEKHLPKEETAIEEKNDNQRTEA
jgi:hypothetical protein